MAKRKRPTTDNQGGTDTRAQVEAKVRRMMMRNMVNGGDCVRWFINGEESIYINACRLLEFLDTMPKRHRARKGGR